MNDAEVRAAKRSELADALLDLLSDDQWHASNVLWAKLPMGHSIGEVKIALNALWSHELVQERIGTEWHEYRLMPKS